MIKLAEIVSFLNSYLSIDEVEDISWNGLQVEGREDVKKIGFAVDASMDTFKKAIKEECDLLIVHHGHYWKQSNPSIISWKKERLEYLLSNQLSLYTAHLPLDRHKEVGNNAQLIKIMGAKITDEFIDHKGKNISWIGEFKKEIDIKDIVAVLNKHLQTKCTILNFGNSSIKTVAICSGGGGYASFYEALEKEVDLYLTGDRIDIFSLAKDAKFNVIFAGHNATETLGVKALSLKLKEKFNIEAIFLNSPTNL